MKVGVEPIRINTRAALPYEDIADYVKAWPDKLVAFVNEAICDDDMRAFAERLYEYICEPDKDGPAFEKWVNS